MDRRGFLKTMLTALGAAAVAHPLGDLVAGELRHAIPPAGKLIMPPGESFFVQRFGLWNWRAEVVMPRLLIGSWELEAGFTMRPGELLHFDFGPQGGYQLDPGEKIALMGKEMGVALHGFKFDHGPLREPGGSPYINSPFIPYTYWLRV